MLKKSVEIALNRFSFSLKTSSGFFALRCEYPSKEQNHLDVFSIKLKRFKAMSNDVFSIKYRIRTDFFVACSIDIYMAMR